MSTEFQEQEKERPPLGKRDVAALFGRLGLDASRYREFATRRDEPRTVEIPRPDDASEVWARPDGVNDTVPISTPLSPAPASSSGGHWNALDLIFASPRNSRSAGRPAAMRVALFSLVGGAGKTTLAVSLARLLSRRSIQVVLVNYSNDFALRHYLQPKSPRFGSLTFLHAPEGAAGIPVTVINASTGGLAASYSAFSGSLGSCAEGEHANQCTLLIQQASHSADIVLYDMPVTADRASCEFLQGADHVLVPLLPDLQSATSIPVVDSLLRFSLESGPEVKYVFNRFEPSRPFHRDLRARVGSRLGGRLLPMAIREEPLIAEAMASGLTVLDFAPAAPVMQELDALADWLGSLQSRSARASAGLAQGAVA